MGPDCHGLEGSVCGILENSTRTAPVCTECPYPYMGYSCEFRCFHGEAIRPSSDVRLTVLPFKMHVHVADNTNAIAFVCRTATRGSASVMTATLVPSVTSFAATKEIAWSIKPRRLVTATADAARCEESSARFRVAWVTSAPTAVTAARVVLEVIARCRASVKTTGVAKAVKR